MNFELIGNLVRLRYKLLWAKTRSRNGRIALFMAGYLLLVLLIALFASGGFGAALVAVRTGKAELVAQVVLSGLYVQAAMAALSGLERTSVVLNLIYGSSTAEVAELLDTTPGAIRAAIARAREKLEAAR